MMPGWSPSRGVLTTTQPPGVDIGEITTDLADNAVAAPGDQTALTAVVDNAATEHDLQLSVIVVPDASGSAELAEFADQIQQDRGGTVLVLSPDFAGARSDRYDSATVTDALQGLPLGDAQAADAFVANLTDPGPPWLIIVLTGAALLAVLAVGGRWWERRRRHRKDATALAAEGNRLRDEVAEMADDILAVEPQITLRGDAELATEYSQIAVAYQELTHAVERDPRTRRAADKLSTQVSALRERVEAINAAMRR